MMKIYLLAGLLAGSVLATAAQTLDPTFTPPASMYTPGTIYSLGPQQADGKRVVMGDFQRLSGVPTALLARLQADGTLDQTFTQNLGAVPALSGFAAGINSQYLLWSYGQLTAGGLTRNRLLRLQANGAADPTFDAGAGPVGDIGAVAVQPDGKTLVVAASSVVRLNLDGTVDPTFTTTTGSFGVLGGGYAHKILVLPTGKILIIGRFDTLNGAPTNSLLLLNADGSVDATFQPALPTGTDVADVVAQPNGSLVVHGYLGYGSSTLLRLLATGALDPGFTAPASLSQAVGSVTTPLALLPNGQLLMCGDFGTSRFARLNSNGSLDTSFALSAAPSSDLAAVGVQANGDIWLASLNFDHQFGGFEGPLAAFSSAGTWQPGFNPKPQVSGYVQAAVRQPTGELLVGGSFTEWNGQPVHHLVRLSSTGTLTTTAFTAAAGPLPGRVTALALQPDGQVLAGTTHGLRRLAASGTRDAGFSCFLGELSVSALAVQPDGRILMGWAYTPAISGSYNHLVRLSSTGSQDASFVRAASNGGTGTPFSATALLVQRDGRIVTGGWNTRASGGRSAAYVMRYLPDGAADPTFTPANFWGGTTFVEFISTILQQPDGKLVVAGLFKNAGNVTSARVARLGTDGLPDPGFAWPTSMPVVGPAYTAALQPNGRILEPVMHFPAPEGGF